MQHLDVAGGTGDVAFRVLRAIQTAEQLERQQQQAWQQPPSLPPQQQQQQQPGQQQQQGAVTVFDINAEMLEVGKQRAQAQGELEQQPSLPAAYLPARPQHSAVALTC
jgi:2-methoxy-6-polyprenyl-1,4-benzoquinol methylase